jgi:hypothetical protein
LSRMSVCNPTNAETSTARFGSLSRSSEVQNSLLL